MAVPTHFLPAERLPRAQVLGQARQIGESPVLSAMLDTAPGMVALLNSQRQIVLCNDACAKAGKLADKSEALGMRPGELLRCIHTKDAPGGCGTSESCRYCSFVEAVLDGQQGRAALAECLLQCHSGDGEVTAEYAVKVNPLPELGAGWQCFSLKDISHEKRREALERTFFHDILNRAGAVQSLSTMLAGEDVAPEERKELLGMLVESADALVDEIRSQHILLAAETGELSVVRRECDSIEALRTAAATCRTFGLVEAKRVAIRPDAQSIRFQTDPTLLGRILINLLKNALEASGPGATVTAACSATEPGHIRFSVHNDKAMPDHVRAHVFKRSFSTKGGGRGLGTYSVKLLSESYLGGRVRFETSPSLGTIFHADFPC